jgi:uncharacterized membrane protein YkoI
MGPVERLSIVAVTVLALAPARAEQAARPPQVGAAAIHACLDQKERRAATETGKVVRLATAMRAAKKRMPGTVVRARLCHGRDGLVYVLTVLARNGKVARLTVDAVKGTLIGR